VTTTLEAARRRQQEDIDRLSALVPRADDPELAEHALWNDELAADAEAGAKRTEAAYASVRECPCGMVGRLPGELCPCGKPPVSEAEAGRRRIARAIRGQIVPCPEHQSPPPKGSCWRCGRNAAFERSARIAERGVPG